MDRCFWTLDFLVVASRGLTTLPWRFLKSKTIETITPFVHMGWVDAGSVPTRVQMSLMITVGLGTCARATWTYKHQRWLSRHTSFFCCSQRNAPSAPTLAEATTVCVWSHRGRRAPSPCWQFWPSAQSVTAPGLSRGPNSFENSGRRELPSGSRWCLLNQTLASVHRKSTRPLVTGNSTAPREVETPEIHGEKREERSFDPNFPRRPRESPK